MNYLDQVKHTYIENWPSLLCNLSIAQVNIPLTIIEARTLGSCIMEYGECFKGETCDINQIRQKVATAVTKFPNGAFVRLGSRSPKDAWGAYDSMKITTTDDPLKLLLDCSERISDDLTLAISNNYEPHIFVRQWIDIPKWTEFRCFMHNRRLTGISQYYYRDGAFPEIAENAGAIEWAIENFFNDFKEIVPFTDIIFDVFIKIKTKDSQRSLDVKLIEINPYSEMTDPCLYDWRKDFPGNFSRRFRYVE